MLCKWFFLEDFLSTNVRFHKFGQHWRFPTGLLSGKWQFREALTFLNSQSTILNYQIHSIQCNLHDHEDRFWSHFHTLDTICAPIPAPSASWWGVGVYFILDSNKTECFWWFRSTGSILDSEGVVMFKWNRHLTKQHSDWSFGLYSIVSN